MEEGKLQGEEAEQFKSAVSNIMRDTPAAAVAVSRMRKLMTKIGPQAAKFVRDTLKDVVSESVKRPFGASSRNMDRGCGRAAVLHQVGREELPRSHDHQLDLLAIELVELAVSGLVADV